MPRFFATLVNFVLPPRKTERLVGALGIDDLRALQSGGSLPYQAQEASALVWEIKYYGSTRAAQLAGQFVSEELLAIASEELGRPLLIPVPMHPARLRERGHNHTELLCESALSHLDTAYEYAPHALERIVHTKHQQGLERKKRLNNVKNSMKAAEAVKGRVCVVLDDVTTTGATLAEAKRALLAAGAARVHCVALAQS